MKKILVTSMLLLTAAAVNADYSNSNRYNQPSNYDQNNGQSQNYNQQQGSPQQPRYSVHVDSYSNQPSDSNQPYDQSQNYNTSSSNQYNNGQYNNQPQRPYNNSNNPQQNYNQQGQYNNQPGYGQTQRGNYLSDADDNSKSNDKYPQDQAMTDSDLEINKNIRKKISGWFSDSFKDVAISTSNGVVTLSGFVNSSDDLKKLNEDVRKVDGVKSVNNNVSVRQK